MSKEAMKLALEAIEEAETGHAAQILREALAEQPAQQEPVAFYIYKPTLPHGNLGQVADGDLPWVYDQAPSSGFVARMLVTPYTPQPPAQPLTDEMVTAAARALNKRQAEFCGMDKNNYWKFYGDDIKEDARAVLEAAHGITKGNT